MKEKRLIAVLISLFGAIMYSSKAIFVKMAYRVEAVDSVTLLTLRMIFTLPFYGFSHFFRQKNVEKTDGKIIKGAMIAGFLFYLSALLDFEGLKYITAGIERLVLFLYPSFVVLISFFFYKKNIFKYQVVGLLLTYLGISLAFWEEANIQNFDKNFLLGVGLIFLCSITYAIYVIQNGIYLQNIGTERFTNLTMFTMAFFAITYFLLTQKTSQLFDLQAETYFIVIAMALFSTVVPSYLMSYGIKKIGAADAAIVNSIGPLSTIVQAYFILGENFGLFQMLGTSAVLAGVYWIGKRQNA